MEQGHFSFTAVLTILFPNVMYMHTYFLMCVYVEGLYVHTEKWDVLKR